MDVQLPDGTILRGVPDGTTKAQIAAKLKANGRAVPTEWLAPAAPAEKSVGDKIAQGLGNIAAGAVRGAGSIGATLLAPVDIASDAMAGKGLSLESNRQRRAAMDAGLQELGADPNSIAYKGGKLLGEVAGTAGAGGAVANVVGRAAPSLAAANPNLLTAIRTAGMEAGGATGLANPLVRAAGGAINGGLTAGVVDPEQAGTGAVVGGVAPGVVRVAGKAGEYLSDKANSAAKSLMQSALKPTIRQLKDGSSDTAVDTLLTYGISPTQGGVNKLRELVDAKNAEIASQIANSSATVSKQNVLSALTDVQKKFGSQVSPTADLAAIQKVADDFASHPNFSGAEIPVQAAQEMKQGTYRVLRDKYGQLGSADTEAQKALARGLKDEISSAVPGVSALNAEEARLLKTLSVTERRALMDANKNPMGLASLASNPLGWAAFMADRSAAFKALAARIVNATAPAARVTSQGAIGLSQNPLLRSAGVLAAAEANP